MGTTWAIVLPAGTYGSELSLADAQAKAQAAWLAIDTQENANLNGSCIPAVNIRLGITNNAIGDANGQMGGAYNPIAAILIDGAEMISNTAYSGNGSVRYADKTLPAAARNIDVRIIFSNSPQLPYRIRIPSKNQTSPVLNGPQTYRFANIVTDWGDPDLIIIVEPA